MRTLICNSTSYGHVDYEKPISVYKSTDYRTSTGSNHRFIPPFPQDFDARVKFPIRTVSDPILSDDFYLSDSHRHFKVKKSVKDPTDPKPAQTCFKLNFLKSVEEKLFRNPPRPIPPVKTEQKEAYERKSVPHDPYTPGPTIASQHCEMRALGRDEQPPFRPEQNGYWKLLDNYLTTTRASYIPYDQTKQGGIARKDIITYYDASGVPHGGKGYGPKNVKTVKPMVPRRIKPDDRDLKVLSIHYPVEPIKPFRSKTEYQSSYQQQTQSDFYPFIFDLGVPYNDVQIDASRWQSLAPPGMYCTEMCHYGTGYDVRAVVEVKEPPKIYKHNITEYCDCIHR